MTFAAKLKDLAINFRGGGFVLTLTTDAEIRGLFNMYADKDIDITIKPRARGRSLDANAYCWALCKCIADVLRISKEDVYRRAIRDVGEYYPLPIKHNAVDAFVRVWTSRGTGWFVERVDGCKLPGYQLCFAYYGSSVYTVEQMSRLIDWLTDEMKQQGLPIPLGEKQAAEMLERWGKH